MSETRAELTSLEKQEVSLREKHKHAKSKFKKNEKTISEVTFIFRTNDRYSDVANVTRKSQLFRKLKPCLRTAPKESRPGRPRSRSSRRNRPRNRKSGSVYARVCKVSNFLSIRVRSAIHHRTLVR